MTWTRRTRLCVAHNETGIAQPSATITADAKAVFVASISARGAYVQASVVQCRSSAYGLPSFTSLFFEGGRYNDYRLREGQIEFRINEGKWRVLDDSEVQLHFRFHTEVAKWLLQHQSEVNPSYFLGV